ncbi:hypothetical protein GW17_00045243 [Ensete ventricosum]|nr:hypothetical protein GW17_00045243 [Ensete ventricosum]
MLLLLDLFRHHLFLRLTRVPHFRVASGEQLQTAVMDDTKQKQIVRLSIILRRPSTAVVAVAGRRLKRAFGCWIDGLGADQLVATLGRHAVFPVVGGTTSAVRALMVTSQHTAGHIGKSQWLDLLWNTTTLRWPRAPPTPSLVCHAQSKSKACKGGVPKEILALALHATNIIIGLSFAIQSEAHEGGVPKEIQASTSCATDVTVIRREEEMQKAKFDLPHRAHLHRRKECILSFAVVPVVGFRLMGAVVVWLVLVAFDYVTVKVRVSRFY